MIELRGYYHPVWASDPEIVFEPTSWTWLGHDRTEWACDCKDGLRPWKHCPAHFMRARIVGEAGIEDAGPYWR